MKQSIRFVGLDVHAEMIAVAVAEASGEVRSLGTVPNRPESVAKALRKLGPAEALRVCYEAGPCGYVLYWQLVKMGIECMVVAPSLIPTRPGDRVKTDRRDAEKLATNLRAGTLTGVWVPDEDHEALRDLVRVREAAKKDQAVARHRLQKFLLRHGVRPPTKMKSWTLQHMAWLRTLRFSPMPLDAAFRDLLLQVDHAADRIKRIEQAIDEAVAQAAESVREVVKALQALRGIAKITAVTLVAEVGRFSRFHHPTQLMGYSGAVPSEYSTGGPDKHKRGAITKTGNSHLRRVVIEAAWAYRHRSGFSQTIKKRQNGLSPAILAIAGKAQTRLCGRYNRMVARGKCSQKVITAIGRELLGFIWAIAVATEAQAA